MPYEFACGGDVPEDGFRDVPADNVHEPAIDCAVALGLATGTSSTTYTPQAPVTRAQMATFVVRLLKANGTYLGTAAPDAFDDDNGSAHEQAINQLAAIGLVRGTGERTYSPGGAVTRGQMATYLVRTYERHRRVELPQALARFADVDGTTHQRSIDQAAGLRVASGVSPTAYAPDRTVGRDQMARFLASAHGCMGVLLRDGQYHYPQCDAYTETDGARALSGFELTVATNDDHYTASEGVGVLIAACNRRDVPLRQVFPQKDWFSLEARHEQLSRSGWEPDRQWYDHRWAHTLNGAGYRPRDIYAPHERVSAGHPQLSALTWYDGPQATAQELVVWQPGECKTLDAGRWQQGDKSTFHTELGDFPAQWRYRPNPIYRTSPGWYTLRLHWGGVEVGQARRYLTVDAPRLHLDGPRLTAGFEQRRYEPDETVPVTVSACNDSDEPYTERIGSAGQAAPVEVFRVSVSGNAHDGSQQLGAVTSTDLALSWAPAECKTWEFSWDQRINGQPPAASELFRVSVEWNPSSEERPQRVSGHDMALR